jgi:hypothetical protein
LHVAPIVSLAVQFPPLIKALVSVCSTNYDAAVQPCTRHLAAITRSVDYAAIADPAERVVAQDFYKCYLYVYIYECVCE